MLIQLSKIHLNNSLSSLIKQPTKAQLDIYTNNYHSRIFYSTTYPRDRIKRALLEAAEFGPELLVAMTPAPSTPLLMCASRLLIGLSPRLTACMCPAQQKLYKSFEKKETLSKLIVQTSLDTLAQNGL
jgi:hypothetical protein